MPARAPSPPAQELSANERDDIQLDSLQSTIRDLIREDIGLDEADTAINNLQGHQDIKDMFSGVGGMEYVPRVRVLLDILDLIRTKRAVLAQAIIEEAEENELAEADTDVGLEADSESDSDDEPFLRQPSGLSFAERRRARLERTEANLREIFASDDSDDDESRSSSPWQDPLGDNYDWSNASPPSPRRQRPRDSFFFSDDESDSDEDSDGAPGESFDDIANADTEDVSAQLRF